MTTPRTCAHCLLFKRNIADGLDLDIAGDLVEGEDIDVRIELVKHPAEIDPDDLTGEYDRCLGELVEFFPQLPQLGNDLLHDVRTQGQIDPPVVLGQGREHSLFHLGVKRHHAELSILTEAAGDGPAQGTSDLFRDHVDVVGRGAGVCYRLQNGS